MEIILGFDIQNQYLSMMLNKQEYKLAAINYDSNIISYSNYQVDVIYVSKESLIKLNSYTEIMK